MRKHLAPASGCIKANTVKPENLSLRLKGFNIFMTEPAKVVEDLKHHEKTMRQIKEMRTQPIGDLTES